MIYSEITAKEAMEYVLTGETKKLYFQMRHGDSLKPLEDNNISIVNVTDYRWFIACEDSKGFSLRDAIRFTLKYHSHETSTTKLIDDIATDYIKTLKERKTSE